MDLKNLYQVAYNFDEPFDGEYKNVGEFLFSCILFNIKEADENAENISFIDLYCWFLNKAGITLDDVEYAFNKFASENRINFDSTLYYNFCENKLFDKFNRAKELMPEFFEKQSKIDFNKVHNTSEDYCTYDRMLLAFGDDGLLFSVLVGDYNKSGVDIKNKGSKGLVKLLQQYYKLNNVQFDYPRLTEKIIREGKFEAKAVHKVTKKMFEDCNSSKIQKIEKVLKTNPKTKKLNAVSFANKSSNYDTFAENYKNITNLKNYIVGQDDAVKQITNKILSSYVGFSSDKQPVASFLLTGPTGVGKTETAKAVAYLCTNGKIFTVDMTTFKNDADISRLLGGSPNYIGYGDKNEFCDFLLDNPNCVLLFDEIDKAHKGCLDLLMRILDEGEFINAKGKVISLHNAIIFCTTNLTEYIDSNNLSLPQEKLTTLGGFRKEIVGRFSNVIEYKKLDKQACRQITKNILDSKIASFENNNLNKLKLEYTESLNDTIISEANTDFFGARDLGFAIQKFFIDPVSNYIIESGIKNASIKVTENGIEGQKGLHTQNRDL